jgi:hypothetical protein
MLLAVRGLHDATGWTGLLSLLQDIAVGILSFGLCLAGLWRMAGAPAGIERDIARHFTTLTDAFGTRA